MREKNLFLEAIEIEDDAEREAFLTRECGEDLELHSAVHELLVQEQKLGTFLELKDIEIDGEFNADFETRILEQPKNAIGSSIGKYKLRKQIGEGGMGIVYVAQQTHPVQREVALKLIKPGMDSKQVIARFEAERQALALMDHPNISRVLDAGTAENGLPYFVMELVDGIPINEFCNQNRLDIVQRLRLVIAVCQAVQHAHVKGIIHRDIKPSNVLVTRIDNQNIPKVIDFGVAKATAQNLTDRTIYTQFTQMIGTPLYMSPEQATRSGNDVDTRSDVYSLGVVLYELLTGTTPFDPETLRHAEADEIRQIICGREPPAPSTRVKTTNSEGSSTDSEYNGVEFRQLSRMIQGELDWITLKAMDKDRRRRYSSPGALAADIQAYLDGTVVAASPPSLVYRTRKFAKRNAVFLTTATLVTVTLIVATVISLWQAGVAIDALAKIKIQQSELFKAKAFAEEIALRAKENEAHANLLVYAADIRQAAEAWKKKDIRQYTDILDRYQTVDPQFDPRGFEWRFLNQLGRANYEVISEAADGYCVVRHSRDGRFIACGRSDGRVDILDGKTHQPMTTLEGHLHLVRGVHFSAKCDKLATLGEEGIVRIWSTRGFDEISQIKVTEGTQGEKVFFAKDDELIVTIGEEDRVKIWETATGKLYDSFGVNGNEIRSLDVSPDGKFCVAGEHQHKLRTWDFEKRKTDSVMGQMPLNDFPRCVRYSPDGSVIAVGSELKKIYITDAKTGEIIESFPAHRDDIQDIAFYPDGRLVASVDRAGVIYVWRRKLPGNPSSTANQGLFPKVFRAHDVRTKSIDCSPDGGHFLSASNDRTVRSWAPQTMPIRELDFDNVSNAVFSPDGSELFIGGEKAITIWNQNENTFRLLAKIDQSRLSSIAITNDGKTLATGHEDGVIRFWDLETETFSGSVKAHDDDVESVSFSHDDALLATASWDGTSCVLDVSSREKQSSFPLGHHCTNVSFSPIDYTFSVTHDSDIAIINALSEKRIHLLKGHQNSTYQSVFSPDGQQLASCSHDRTVRIWDITTGETIHEIFIQQDKICSLAYSPDGKTLASGDNAGNLAFSHASTGRFLFFLTVQSTSIRNLSFTPSGEDLFLVPSDHNIQLMTTPKGPTQ